MSACFFAYTNTKQLAFRKINAIMILAEKREYTKT